MNKFDIHYPIYYINLDRSFDRRKRLENEFKRLGIKNYHRVQAYDAKKTGLKYIHNIKKKHGRIAYACTCSHIKAVQTFLKSGKNIGLIFEDDASLEYMPFWDKKMSQYVNDAPKDWDVIMLSAFTNQRIKLKFNKYNQGIYCATAYMINRKAALILMEKTKIHKDGTFDFGTMGMRSIGADSYMFNFFSHVYCFPLLTYGNGPSTMNHKVRIHQIAKNRITDMWKNTLKINVNYPIYYINSNAQRENVLQEEFKIYNLKNCKKIQETSVNNGVNHLNALREFVKSGNNIGIIIENNISFDFIPHWKKYLQQYINQTPSDWEIISLTSNIPLKPMCYKYIQNMYSSTAYIIKKQMAQNLVNRNSINFNGLKNVYCYPLFSSHKKSKNNNEQLNLWKSNKENF